MRCAFADLESLAYSVTVERREYIGLDPSIEADLAFLAAQRIGDWELQSRTEDDRTWIVGAASDTMPVAAYRYERAARTLTKLYDVRPDLDGAPLVAMYPVTIEARDGLALVCCLSRPAAADRPGPMVLLVHGGPWSRDLSGYHAQHQWFANRGYADGDHSALLGGDPEPTPASRGRPDDAGWVGADARTLALHQAGRIRRSLLIAQGANDPRVKQAESDQMVAAMKANGIPVTYVLFPDEGHGFARPENSMAFNAVTEAFLASHLGGRTEPATTTELAASTIRFLEGGEFVRPEAGDGTSIALGLSPGPELSGRSPRLQG